MEGKTSNVLLTRWPSWWGKQKFLSCLHCCEKDRESEWVRPRERGTKKSAQFLLWPVCLVWLKLGVPNPTIPHSSFPWDRNFVRSCFVHKSRKSCLEQPLTRKHAHNPTHTYAHTHTQVKWEADADTMWRTNTAHPPRRQKTDVWTGHWESISYPGFDTNTDSDAIGPAYSHSRPWSKPLKRFLHFFSLVGALLSALRGEREEGRERRWKDLTFFRNSS